MYRDKKNETGPFVVSFTLFALEVFGTIHFRADVQKFLGFDWIATGPDGLVLFHSQNELFTRLFQMEDAGSLLLVLELDDYFDSDFKDVV